MSLGSYWDSIDETGGYFTVNVIPENLHDFPKFVAAIVKEKVGLSQGFFKIRVKGGSTSRTKLETLCKYIEAALTKGVATVQRQKFFYGSEEDDVYGYQQAVCSAVQAVNFVKKVSDPATFSATVNKCCADALANSPATLESHYWRVVRKNSEKGSNAVKRCKKSEVESLLSDGAQKRIAYGVELDAAMDSPKVFPVSPKARPKAGQNPAVLYCPGIPVNETFFVCENFTLSALRTILDLHPQPIPGVTNPFLYVAGNHSTFPWHIEDGGLFSINALHYGAPCIWFIVPPSEYKKLATAIHFFPLSAGHVSCLLNLLHKYVVASRKYLKQFGVEAAMVIQAEGEIVVTYPFAAHSGMKLGPNISEAANFADPWWVEAGMLLRPCACLEDSFSLSFKEMIAVARPHLLKLYLEKNIMGLSSVLVGNEFVRMLGLLPPAPNIIMEIEETQCTGEDQEVGKVESLQEEEKVSEETQVEFKGSRYCLKCPVQGCPKMYEGGRARRQRMLQHIRINHEACCVDVIKKFHAENPSKDIKSRCLVCPICKCKRAGNKSHLKKHILRKHKGVDIDLLTECL